MSEKEITEEQVFKSIQSVGLSILGIVMIVFLGSLLLAESKNELLLSLLFSVVYIICGLMAFYFYRKNTIEKFKAYKLSDEK